jgi:hypothetical protein
VCAAWEVWELEEFLRQAQAAAVVQPLRLACDSGCEGSSRGVDSDALTDSLLKAGNHDHE